MTKKKKNVPDALYLIALVPPEPLREAVKTLKLEMSDRFRSSHALKIPAHITLQMPFRRPVSFEDPLCAELRQFSTVRQVFNIRINGFGAFPPRVIYLDIENPAPVARLQHDLQQLLKENLKFPGKELPNGFHPHMTIATRDLSKAMFNKAWPEFQKRRFSDEFTAGSLHLLKHNGTNWDLFREFEFHR